jgi:hypothetical protein
MAMLNLTKTALTAKLYQQEEMLLVVMFDKFVISFPFHQAAK